MCVCVLETACVCVWAPGVPHVCPPVLHLRVWRRPVRPCLHEQHRRCLRLHVLLLGHVRHVRWRVCRTHTGACMCKLSVRLIDFAQGFTRTPIVVITVYTRTYEYTHALTHNPFSIVILIHAISHPLTHSFPDLGGGCGGHRPLSEGRGPHVRCGCSRCPDRWPDRRMDLRRHRLLRDPLLGIRRGARVVCAVPCEAAEHARPTLCVLCAEKEECLSSSARGKRHTGPLAPNVTPNVVTIVRDYASPPAMLCWLHDLVRPSYVIVVLNSEMYAYYACVAIFVQDRK